MTRQSIPCMAAEVIESDGTKTVLSAIFWPKELTIEAARSPWKCVTPKEGISHDNVHSCSCRHYDSRSCFLGVAGDGTPRVAF